jgi:hypothetical protein
MTNIMKLNPLLLGMSLTLAGFAYAQDASPVHAHQHTLVVTSPGKAMLPGGIDGSKTPELIPDAVAYRVFFRALVDGEPQGRPPCTRFWDPRTSPTQTLPLS